MSENICSCEKCCGHKVTDPATGRLVQGRLLGKNELFEHRRLARMKQRFGVGMADDDATIQAGSGSNPQSNYPILKSGQDSESVPSLKDIGRLSLNGTAHHYCRCSVHNLTTPYSTKIQSRKFSQSSLAGKWRTIRCPLEIWSSLLHL